MIFQDLSLYSTGILGITIVQSLFAVAVCNLVFQFLPKFIEPDFRIDDKTYSRLIQFTSLGSGIVLFGIRLIFEKFGISTDFYLFHAIMATIFGITCLLFIEFFNPPKERKTKSPFKQIQISRYKTPIIFIIGIFWIIEILNWVTSVTSYEVRDKFKWSFLFTGILILVLSALVIIVNAIIGERKQIDSFLLQKSMILTNLLIYGIWAFQLTFFGLFGGFSGNYLFFSFFYYIPLSILYFIAFFLILTKIKTSYTKFLESIYLNSDLNLEIQSKNTTNDDTILDVKNLKTYFYTPEGIVRAVEGVSFSIKKDEVLGLVGETGCGKSVTALSILQLVRSPGKIIGGKIFFQNEDLLKKSKSEMLKYRGKEITMIFQDPINSVNPVFRAGAQITEIFLLHKKKELYQTVAKYRPEIEKVQFELKEIAKTINESEKRNDTNPKAILKDQETKIAEIPPSEINLLRKRQTHLNSQLDELSKYSSIYSVAREWGIELLKNVGIPAPEKIYDRYPHELSGGMRQRIMIAMGLACSPKLLIADEPTTALDVTVQIQILNLMAELREKYQTSILYITHDLGVISRICDKVAVMYSGYIVEFADVKTLFSHPLHPYTYGLISAIPSVNSRNERLPIIPGTVPNLIYPPTGCRFHPRCKYSFGPCPKSLPDAFKVGDNHTVSCFLYDPQRENETRKARGQLDKIRFSHEYNLVQGEEK